MPSPLPVFPPTNWWNLDVSAAPVDGNSTSFINFIGPGVQVHPDFGGTVDPGPPPSDQVYGMPYIVVHGTQPKRQVTFVLYGSESDGVGVPFYPIPDQAITTPHWIEGGEPGTMRSAAKTSRTPTMAMTMRFRRRLVISSASARLRYP